MPFGELGGLWVLSHLRKIPRGGNVSRMETKSLRPDAKGRIALGELAEGVSSFRVAKREDGVLELHPFTEIPAREAWLFKNQAALASVRRGLEQAGRGELVELGSFAGHAPVSDDTDEG